MEHPEADVSWHAVCRLLESSDMLRLLCITLSWPYRRRFPCMSCNSHCLCTPCRARQRQVQAGRWTNDFATLCFGSFPTCRSDLLLLFVRPCRGRMSSPCMACSTQWHLHALQNSPISNASWPLDHRLFIASAADTIRRLRNHACLALWCGGNEQVRARGLRAASPACLVLVRPKQAREARWAQRSISCLPGCSVAAAAAR